jgi:hypothetical protein
MAAGRGAKLSDVRSALCGGRDCEALVPEGRFARLAASRPQYATEQHRASEGRPFVHGPTLGLASRERFVDKPQTPALSEFPSPS